MKPNFKSMTRQELKAYVLKHREDIEALNVLISRRSPDEEATWYNFADNKQVTEAILQQKINQQIEQ